MEDTSTIVANTAFVQAAINSAPTPQAKVLEEIQAERAYQDNKWGGKGFDDSQTTGQFIGYIQEYLNGANFGSVRGKEIDTRAAFIKVAALAVATVESMDRKAFQGGR